MKMLLSDILRAGFASREAFDVAVADYLEETRSWTAHMARVEADSKLPPLTVPKAMDYLSEDQGQFDRDRFNADHRAYETELSKRHQPYPKPVAHHLIAERIDPDDPVYEIIDDGPTAEQILAAKKHEVLAEILRAEEASLEAMWPNLKRAHHSFAIQDVLAKDETDRSAADNEVISQHEARSKRINAIHRHAAKLRHDLHDMTSVDDWTLDPFPI